MPGPHSRPTNLELLKVEPGYQWLKKKKSPVSTGNFNVQLKTRPNNSPDSHASVTAET